MTVKELMKKLEKCSPNATVCIEAWMDQVANKVKEYIIDGKPYVYIGDDLDELEYELGLHNDEEE